MFTGSGIRMGTSLGAHYEHQGGEWRWRQRQSQALGLGPPSVRKLGSWGAAGSEGVGRVYRVLGATWRRAAGWSLRAAVSVLAGGGTAAINIEMTPCFTFSLCQVREVWVGSPLTALLSSDKPRFRCSSATQGSRLLRWKVRPTVMNRELSRMSRD